FQRWNSEEMAEQFVGPVDQINIHATILPRPYHLRTLDLSAVEFYSAQMNTTRPIHWNADLLAAAALLALTFLAYWNSLHGAFVFDDQTHIIENHKVTGVRSLGGVISGGIGWRQLLFATYRLNFYWGRLNPFGYHLVNVTLHALSAILVYFIIIQLAPEKTRRYIAITGAAVFSVHTLLTSAVSYVAG